MLFQETEAKVLTGNGTIHSVLPQSLSFPSGSQGCAVRSDSVHSGDLWEGQSQLGISGFFCVAEFKVAWRMKDGAPLSSMGPMEPASGSSSKPQQC